MSRRNSEISCCLSRSHGLCDRATLCTRVARCDARAHRCDTRLPTWSLRQAAPGHPRVSGREKTAKGHARKPMCTRRKAATEPLCAHVWRRVTPGHTGVIHGCHRATSGKPPQATRGCLGEIPKSHVVSADPMGSVTEPLCAHVWRGVTPGHTGVIHDCQRGASGKPHQGTRGCLVVRKRPKVTLENPCAQGEKLPRSHFVPTCGDV